MSDEEYSLKEVINENHKVVLEALNEVKEQVKRTNGRVKSLELWKAAMIGAFTLLSAIIIPIAIEVLKK